MSNESLSLLPVGNTASCWKRPPVLGPKHPPDTVLGEALCLSRAQGLHTPDFFFVASFVLGLDSPRVLKVVRLAGSRGAAAALACVENGVSLQQTFGRQEGKKEEKAREGWKGWKRRPMTLSSLTPWGMCSAWSALPLSVCVQFPLVFFRADAWLGLLRVGDRLSPAKRTDMDIRVTSQPCFLGPEAGAVALASRAQETSRECIDGEHCERRRGAQEDDLLNAISRHALEQFSPQMRCLECFSREVMWPFLKVLEISQMLVTAGAWSDATRCGPQC